MLDSSRELAADAGIECRQVTSGIDALLDADELFLTNSLVEIAPVSAVAGLMFAAPRAGQELAPHPLPGARVGGRTLNRSAPPIESRS